MGRISAGIVCSVLVTTVFASMVLFIPTEVSSADDVAVLDIGYMQKVDSLNPYLGLTDSSYFLYGLMYDSLQSIDEDLQPTPNLAKEWRIVPESDPDMVVSGEPYGSVWEYNLTTNANWTDGEPFTADDVAYTMNLNSLHFDELWAFQPYAYFINFSEAVDSDTVRIHFSDRSTGEPMPCAFGDSLFIPILPKHILETMSPSEIGFSWDGTVDGVSPPIVGTGPFMPTSAVYDEFVTGIQITLVRNPYYHGFADYGKEIQFDGLVMRFYDDPTAIRYGLQSGYVDVAQMPVGSYQVLRDGVANGSVANISCYDGPKSNQYFTEVAINMMDAGPNPSRLDPAIRAAMALATNKTHIVEEFYLGEGAEGSTLVSPVNEYWHYEPSFNELYRYALDNASNLLEVSGYQYTVSSPDVRVATADSWAVQQGLVAENTPLAFDMLVRAEYPEEIEIAQFLESEWASVGIDANYRVVTEAQLATWVYAYYYDTAIWCWSSDPDPNYILFTQSTCSINAWNDNRYSDYEYDDNYTASVRALDDADRKANVDACQLIHYQDAPYIILAYPDQTYAWRTDTFMGWGDWSLPGRSLDNFWGANPVLFGLVVVPEVPDTTVPETGCTLDGTLGTEGWYVTLVTVDLSVTDVDGSVVSTRYSLDGGDWLSYTGPFEVSDDGEHTLEYFSVDDSGNSEDAKQATIKIDTTAPGGVECQATGTKVAGSDWYTSGVTVTLSAPVDATSGVATVMCSIDAGVWSTYPGAISFADDGKYEISFYCIDTAGNEGVEGSESVWIDMTGPTVAMSSPAAGESLSSGDATLEFTCSDAASGVASVWVSVDGGAEVSVDPADDSYTLEDLADGTHTVTVRAVDEAGNEASQSVLFVVDTPADSTLLYVAGGAAIAAAIGLVALLLLKKKGRLKGA